VPLLPDVNTDDGRRQLPLRVAGTTYEVRRYAGFVEDMQFSLADPRGREWVVRRGPATSLLCAHSRSLDEWLVRPTGYANFAVDGGVLRVVERGTLDWYREEIKLGVRSPHAELPKPYEAPAPQPSLVLEVPDTGEGLDSLTRELDARLVATPPITVDTPYGPLTFTTVPPNHALHGEPLDAYDRDWTDVTTSGQLRVGRRTFTLEGAPLHADSARGAGYQRVLDQHGERLARRSSGSDVAGVAAFRAWDDDSTSGLRHLLAASSSAHALRRLPRGVQGPHSTLTGLLRRGLLRVTADSLTGMECQAARKIADDFPGTSRELVGAVRALLSGPSR